MPEGIFIKPMAKSYPMEQSIGGTMSQIMRSLNPWIDLVLQRFGITHGTWFFMRALWDEDGINQRELANRVGTSAPTTMAALRTLEAAGYVTLSLDTTDRRRNIVRLTTKGKALENDLIPPVAAMNPKVLKGLSKTEVRELVRMLQVIKRNAAEAYAEERKAQANEDAA